MSIFGNPDAKPSLDPLGDDRQAFRKMGAAASKLYFQKHDLNKAMKLIEEFTQKTAKRYTDWHPDVGRASLLLAVISASRADYEPAIMLSNSAAKVLESRGTIDPDYTAAEFLHRELLRIKAGNRPKSEPPVISHETPAGAFFLDLV